VQGGYAYGEVEMLKLCGEKLSKVGNPGRPSGIMSLFLVPFTRVEEEGSGCLGGRRCGVHAGRILRRKGQRWGYGG